MEHKRDMHRDVEYISDMYRDQEHKSDRDFKYSRDLGWFRLLPVLSLPKFGLETHLYYLN